MGSAPRHMTDGVKSALQLTCVAQPPLPPVRTDALEGVDPVDAGAAVLTRRGRAVVDVCGGGENR